MLRNKLHRKMYAVAMLLVFVTLIFVSPSNSIRNNSKNAKSAFATKPAKGAGSLANSDQPSPADNNEEEDDDDFNLELTFEPSPSVVFALEYHTLHESMKASPPRTIISPPPQI